MKVGSSLFQILAVLLVGQSVAGWLLMSRGIREDQGLQQMDQLSQEQARLEKLWGEHLSKVEQAFRDWTREEGGAGSTAGGELGSSTGGTLFSEIVRAQRQTLLAFSKIEGVRAFRLEGPDSRHLVERRDHAALELTARLNRAELSEQDPRWPASLRQEIVGTLLQAASSSSDSHTQHFALVVQPSSSSGSSGGASGEGKDSDETLGHLQEWARTAPSLSPQVRLWSWRRLKGPEPSVLVFQTAFELDALVTAGSWLGKTLSSGSRQGPAGKAGGSSAGVSLKLERKGAGQDLNPKLTYSGPRQSEDARRFSQGGTERIFWGWVFVSVGFLSLAGAIAVAMGRTASAPLRKLIHEIEGMEASDPSSLLRLTGGAGGEPNRRLDDPSGRSAQFVRGSDLLELLILRLRVLFDDLLAERERWVEQNSERFTVIEAENAALKREREELKAAHEQALKVVSDLLEKQKREESQGESQKVAA